MTLLPRFLGWIGVLQTYVWDSVIIHLIVSQTVSLGKFGTKGLIILRWVSQLGKITSNIFSLHNYLIAKY